jgi:hypothetical protein
MEALVFAFPPTLKLTSSLPRRLRRPQLGLAGALIGLVLPACWTAPAQAALISTGACNEATLSQPFLAWGDSSSYELVPGGDFTSSPSAWTLSGGAQRVAGGEPYAVSGAGGGYSLALPQGATAQSPSVCVNASYPTFRFFARNQGVASTVLVQIVYRTLLGSVSVPVGVVALSGEWQPTLPMLTGSLATAALSGGTAEVALRFTAITGASRVDDVFVDPRMV